MKAIRVHQFGGPEELKLEDAANHEPAAGQILVTLDAAGVNPVETYIRSGAYAVLPALPYTPGGEGAGRIAAIGPDIQSESSKSYRVGERVYVAGSLTGTYAEAALCLPSQVHSLPDAISFAQGATLGVAATTAYRALFQRGGAKKGETVLVHGASGGVGTAAVQLARSAGMRVLGTAGSAPGREIVRQAGAEEVFDHRDPNHFQAIQDATNGDGVDVILEMLADVNLDNDLRLVARYGRIVVIGNRGRIEINPRDAMMREADIRGMIGGNASEADRAALTNGLDQALRTGHLHPLIGAEFPLAEAAAAHEAVMASGSRGKIVLTIS
jgi:NADPH:quinone reductase